MYSRIRSLFENGVYNLWVDETLMANNLALKMGLVSAISGKNGYDKAEDNIGHTQMMALKIRNFAGLFYLALAGVLLAFILLAVENRIFQELRIWFKSYLVNKLLKAKKWFERCIEIEM